ncbi:MAG: zinc-dependent metalloprotease [Parvularculaceae bacterium]
MAYFSNARAARTLAAFCAAFLVHAAPAQAEDDDKDDDEPPTIEEKVDGFDRREGLFNLHIDPKKGDVYLEVSADQLGEEFIAFSYTENGVLEAGHFRGAYRDQSVLTFERQFDRLRIFEQNTAFYFDPDSPLARAREANISRAQIANLGIVAQTPGVGDEPARYLVRAESLFLSEALHQVKPTPPKDASPDAFEVGSISKGKTAFDDIRAYPDNIDVVVDYAFDKKYPREAGSDAVTDPRSIIVKVQHSIIAMPDDGYEPRRDDYRVGYFFDKVTDLTSPAAAPYRDLITRWRLEKKDPDAEISDPVQPIVWWIENTTPYEYRDTIRDAVLAWNAAFEKAGFSNAIEVRVQPDDADWDAGDIRYNVLRWTSSPTPPFGGYGPSFTNPRTGEILGADIMLEYVFVTNRLVISDVFDEAASGGFAAHSPHADGRLCDFGLHLHQSNLFARAALDAQGADDALNDELTRQSMYYLLLHEVGHTLGLNHNMKASTLFGPREVHDASLTYGAPTGSVMDYPAPNIAPLGVDQGDYYHTRPGPYDDWAIEFGYRPPLDDPDAETARVAALLARSTERGNVFGNDADDMRSPGVGIDPRVMINDMSSDPVAYAVDRIELARSTLDRLVDKYDDERSWHPLLRGYLAATGQHAVMAQIISRQIGGVYVNRAAPGQQDAAPPYQPTPRTTQEGAMKALADYVFAADAFEAPDALVQRLQPQRRGFEFFGETEDPKIHARALEIQSAVLDHLLHPRVLARLTDARLYGGDYRPVDMIRDLNDAVFGADLRGAPNAFRRNLQTAYAQHLAAIVDNDDYDPTARAAALAGVRNIELRMLFPDFRLSAETKAHREQLRRVFRRF